MLSKILAETKFVQKVLTTLIEFKLTNFSKTKTFFIDKYTKQALQNYKTDLLLFFVKLCKIVVFVFYCESTIFMTIFLPQESKMWKFIGS